MPDFLWGFAGGGLAMRGAYFEGQQIGFGRGARTGLCAGALAVPLGLLGLLLIEVVARLVLGRSGGHPLLFAADWEPWLMQPGGFFVLALGFSLELSLVITAAMLGGGYAGHRLATRHVHAL